MPMRSLRAAIVAGALTLTGAAGAAPPAPEHAGCPPSAAAAPAEKLERARKWHAEGGGEAASRCQAQALVDLARYAEAARLYDFLAEQAARIPERTALLAQAAQAWLLAEQPEPAIRALNDALKEQPEDPALLIDRAEALAATNCLPDAIEDLSRAIDIDNRNADAYAFRGSALRQIDDLSAAAADLDKALTLNPNHPEALLERGIVRKLRGDPAGARADWSRVLTVAPNQPAAEAARGNLARLDAPGG